MVGKFFDLQHQSFRSEWIGWEESQGVDESKSAVIDVVLKGASALPFFGLFIIA